MDHEIWRIVPPEEKFELMAKAQSKGVLASAIFIIIACTLSVGFKASWIMWTSFILSPFIFQFSAGKAWRTLRPKTLLEYLAARSASRRYAFAARSKDLTPKMIFKGVLEELYEHEQIQEAMEAMIQNTKEVEVWITLFGDSVTMIAERFGGAEAQLAAVIDDKLEITSKNSGEDDYRTGKELLVRWKQKDKATKSYKLTSKYPAALVVFEKLVKSIRNSASSVNMLAGELINATGESPEEEEKFNNLFSY